MKKIISAFLCFSIVFALSAFSVKADYVFSAPAVIKTQTVRSANDIAYSFSFSCEEAAAVERNRKSVYESLRDEYTDDEFIAAGQSWLLYETVIYVEAEINGSITYIKDVSVLDGSFTLTLSGDILPQLYLGGLYSHSQTEYRLLFSIAMKRENDYIEASPSMAGETLECPATAKIDYYISDNAYNPNPSYIFMPYEDYALVNPTLDGSTFAGWETDEGFISFIPANTQELSMTARWDARVYKINYVLTTRPGSFIYVDNTGNPKTHVFGEETEIFAVNAPLGYVFGGWYENASFTGESVTAIAADRTGDILLFAKWLTEKEAEDEKLLSEHWGDLDSDGRITAADARLALRCAVGLQELERDVLSRADFEGRGVLTAVNARQLLRIAVGLDTLSSVLAQYGRLNNG